MKVFKIKKEKIKVKPHIITKDNKTSLSYTLNTKHKLHCLMLIYIVKTKEVKKIIQKIVETSIINIITKKNCMNKFHPALSLSTPGLTLKYYSTYDREKKS
ncbi:hypothetical protein RFI_22302 [Reticulomyxa filosa]|uniref:Uncharacterized protein n=1 Tax=Reticulomyxa filosa TaxID=46433 RepID=X6MNQ2_RETFI|nr:hypothetical protein RFI_22302 [Reticulomyxa filosa]|eukprot:ETO15062.1 hypothetical protein RFI_22302 [Reticulomyxa filosa]